MLQVDMSGLHRPIKYRPDIDGLRAVAIVSVVAYHCGLPWLNGGFVGVDVFFVISGYLIGSLVYKEIRGRSFTVSKFYARRARRILPALFVVLLVSYGIAFLVLSPVEMKMFSGSAVASITSSSNIFFWRNTVYFLPHSDQHPLLMAWSLGVEEQFYLLFPLLMLVMRKLQWRLQLLTIGSLTLLSLIACIWGSQHHLNAAYYLPFTRGWELAAGVLVAIFEANRPPKADSGSSLRSHALSILGFGMICLSIEVFDRNTIFPGYFALLPVVGAVLVFVARGGVVNRILASPPIVFVGLVSYSWYLWHWPMLSFASIASDAGLSGEVKIIIGAASFVCAVLSYLLVEKPFRTSTTPAPLLLKRYATAAVLVMLPALAFYFTNGLPQRCRSVQQLEMAESPLYQDQCIVMTGVSHPPLNARCVPAGDGRALALIGDSHAAALASGLRVIADRSGYRLIELTKASCPSLKGVTHSIVADPGFAPECLQFNREVLNYILNEPKVKVVIASAVWADPLHQGQFADRYVRDGDFEQSVSVAESELALAKGLNDLIQSLQNAGKEVYLVQDVPVLNFNPVRLIEARLMRPRSMLARLVDGAAPSFEDGTAPDPGSPDTDEARSIVERAASLYPKAHVIDLHAVFCGPNGCRFADGNQTFYVDSGHLSPLGARIALNGFQLPE
jgi:peptidoglycan/LPS O-acetylase OafA/YrhL